MFISPPKKAFRPPVSKTPVRKIKIVELAKPPAKPAKKTSTSSRGKIKIFSVTDVLDPEIEVKRKVVIPKRKPYEKLKGMIAKSKKPSSLETKRNAFLRSITR